MRCDEFYEKWQRCGNFCKKHPVTAGQIDVFLDQLIEVEEVMSAECEDSDADTASATDMISEKACRPLIKEKNPSIRREMITQIVKKSKDKKASGEKLKVTEKEVIAIGKSIKRQKLAENVPMPTSDDHKVLIGDFRDLSEDIPDNSIDMIFTDPPYDEGSIPLYEDLASVAARVLKPGGSLLAYCGQYALDKILPSMGRHLRFWWVCCIKHGGGYSSLTGKKTYVCWKPMIWFVKEYNGAEEFVFDLVESEPPTKMAHDWEQSTKEAEYFIDKLTKPGDTILDPFCGSGTTCVAAQKLGRKSIAFEIDETTAKIASKRICAPISSKSAPTPEIAECCDS